MTNQSVGARFGRHGKAMSLAASVPSLPKTSLREWGASLCVFVLASLLACTLAGCSSQENLLDSYSKKRKQVETLDKTTESVAPTTNATDESQLTQSSIAEASVAVDKPIAKAVKPISDEAFRGAAYQGDGPTVAAAIESGVNVNSPDENGRTALMLAAYDGHTEIVKLLIKHKAQVNRVDAINRTALIYSASGKNPDTVAALIDAGAKVDVVDKEEAWTALMFASAEGNADVVKLLLEHGADPMRGDVDGENSLQFAAQRVGTAEDKGHTEVLSLLQAEIAADDESSE